MSEPTNTEPAVAAAAPCSDPDWKAIALALLRQVNFAITYLAPKGGGSGVIYNTKTGESQHWKEQFADAIERVPGVKVDRELMHAYDLPARERRRFMKQWREKQDQNSVEQPPAG